MSDIGKGDWVEAVRSWSALDCPNSLVAGALYCVAFVAPKCDLDCMHCGDTRGMAIRLTVDINDPVYAWCQCDFRPLRDGQDRITLKASKRQCEPA